MSAWPPSWPRSPSPAARCAARRSGRLTGADVPACRASRPATSSPSAGSTAGSRCRSRSTSASRWTSGRSTTRADGLHDDGLRRPEHVHRRRLEPERRRRRRVAFRPGHRAARPASGRRPAGVRRPAAASRSGVRHTLGGQTRDGWIYLFKRSGSLSPGAGQAVRELPRSSCCRATTRRPKAPGRARTRRTRRHTPTTRTTSPTGGSTTAAGQGGRGEQRRHPRPAKALFRRGSAAAARTPSTRRGRVHRQQERSGARDPFLHRRQQRPVTSASTSSTTAARTSAPSCACTRSRA